MAAVNQSGLSILPIICEEPQNEEVNDGTEQEEWETTMDRIGGVWSVSGEPLELNTLFKLTS